jgi:hypothetical protein
VSHNKHDYLSIKKIAIQRLWFFKSNKREIKFTSQMESGGNINPGGNSSRHPSQAPWVRQLALPWKQEVNSDTAAKNAVQPAE